jgi:RND superfamily putative drug exporter
VLKDQALAAREATVSSFLFRLARWSFDHRRIVLLLWIVVAGGAIALSAAGGGTENNNFTIPGTESQQAADLLTAKVPAVSGAQTQIVFAVPAGQKVTDASAKSGIEAAVADLAKVPQVVSVSDPFTTAGSISPNGQVALGQVLYNTVPTNVTDTTLDKLQDAVAPARSAGVQVAYSGSVYPGWLPKISELPELIGLVIAFCILAIALGAALAAVLPIITAIIGVLITTSLISALAAVVNVASASTTVALMLGLSCGIDYGLFILSRHRNNLMLDMEVGDSVALAVGTAGSSVVFAGLTVIVALCGLSLAGIPFLTVMGLTAAGAVLIALLISLTLMPAVLGFAGHKITRFFNTRLRPGHHEKVAATAARRPERTFGARWARFVVRWNIPVLIVGICFLGAMAIPAFHIELGLPSGSSEPTSNTARQAYDLTAANFGPGFNGALTIVAEPVASSQAAASMAAKVATVPGIISATPVVVSNGVAVIKAIPSTGPNDPATANLVNRLRADRASIEAAGGANSVLVGGLTASNIDTSAKLSSALPVFLIAVVGLAFLLLTFAFRTILVPIKSILGFLLSVAAAMGMEVALFQWGWGERLFGITKGETISFLPIIMLAIIFGLSSDYEVFVVSRIKESFTKTGRARHSVVQGTGQSARVVTAAALIMFSIFAAFLFGNDPTTKAIGFSFAAGVLLDAFVVRLTLVPAVMAIAGAKFWYHPQWFAKYVPDPDLEGEHLEEKFMETHPQELARH